MEYSFISRQTFDDLVKKYIENLAPNKREKALISQVKLQQIKEVLLDPTNTKLYTYDLIYDTSPTIEFSVSLNQDLNLNNLIDNMDNAPIIKSSQNSSLNNLIDDTDTIIETSTDDTEISIIESSNLNPNLKMVNLFIINY
ncbi:15393_t:CDS:2 [Cetraspora pellucida]|uniref:15393_t:CDS:1 n=1 Tax=Cetraspora pellucida TaxID=1433469 RepID=A0A9N9EHH8_9GLOM|nr:15393_t:CDS:2 [Cetraspora pellucida]